MINDTVTIDGDNEKVQDRCRAEENVGRRPQIAHDRAENPFTIGNFEH